MALPTLLLRWLTSGFAEGERRVCCDDEGGSRSEHVATHEDDSGENLDAMCSETDHDVRCVVAGGSMENPFTDKAQAQATNIIFVAIIVDSHEEREEHAVTMKGVHDSDGCLVR